MALLLAIMPFTWSLSALPVLAGLVLSIISLVRKSAGKGMSITGIALSCAAVLASIGWIAIGVVAAGAQFFLDV